MQRQSEEIWRAAYGERDQRLIEDFSKPAFVDLIRVAARNPSPQEAIRAFDEVVAKREDSGVSIDLARRALIRNAAAGGGASGFASELFGEAASYYAARDIPSYVGAEGRIATVKDSLELKNAIREVARETISRAGTPIPRHASWQRYVSRVIGQLRGAR